MTTLTTETVTALAEGTNDLSIFKAMKGYPWLNPCPRCGYRGSCDCTVLERARAAYPGLIIPVKSERAS